jgi:DNA polymerase/3'-5' exonuclease PolX
MEYERAKKIALEVLQAIRPYCKRAMVAGSIRRQKEQVKDIEIVALPKEGLREEMYRALEQYGRFIKPGTPEVIDWPAKPNAKYLRMMLVQEIKLDLFLASEDNWGGILMLRTGSGSDANGNNYAGFGPGILSRWKKVSGGGRFENGQFRHPNGTLYPLREEQDVFDLAQVEWVDPVYRTSKRAVKPKKTKGE